MSVKSIVEQSIESDFIVVFSKSYCPYCKQAKALLAKLDLPSGKAVKVYELDEMDNGSDIQAYLGEKTGQRTVPNVFVGGKHIGGNDDLQKAHKSGELAKLIQ